MNVIVLVLFSAEHNIVIFCDKKFQHINNFRTEYLYFLMRFRFFPHFPLNTVANCTPLIVPRVTEERPSQPCPFAAEMKTTRLQTMRL